MKYLGRYSDVRKIDKHEFKSTARMFAALYGVVLVITLILKGIVEVQTVFKVDNTVLNMITMVTIIAFVLGIIAIFLGSFVLVIKDFMTICLKMKDICRLLFR